MKNLNLITVFVRVAESRSFTAAGQRLGISASGISKSISQLEEEVGVRLVNRTTRTVSLTEEGTSFFERCRNLLNEIHEAETALTMAHSSPRGKLKVLLPVVFGRRVIMPALPAFLDRHPDLIVDVELSDRVVHMVEESIDVIVAFGSLDDSGLIARKLCNLRFVTCASPAYIRRFGLPSTPDDLEHHRCLAFINVITGRYREWQFSEGGRRYSRTISGKLNVNNAESLLEAAIAGVGIAAMASFVAAEAIAAGKLQIVLPEYIAEGPAVSVVYMPSRHLSPRIQSFVRFMKELVPPNPSWDENLFPSIG